MDCMSAIIQVKQYECESFKCQTIWAYVGASEKKLAALWFHSHWLGHGWPPWIYAFPYMGYHAHLLYVKLSGDGKFTSDDIFKCNWLAKTPLNNTVKGVELLFNCLQHFPT